MQDSIYRYKANEVFAAGSGAVEVGRPGKATTAARAGGSGTSASGSWVYYKVRRGDNLGKIATKNHTTVKNLKSWNNLKGDKIREGQRLKVGRR
jgi:membrane-bound lytic murein transglycosylase D